MKLEMTFAELGAQLAEMHEIAADKRTAFLARLKNFHRLGFPAAFKSSKGKATLYGAADAAQMALAIEMAQLGLSPERTVATLLTEWFPTMMALRMAAQALIDRPAGFNLEGDLPTDDPLSMFIFFDPSALASLSVSTSIWKRPGEDQLARSYFYGGEGIVREGFVRWTVGGPPRFSLINVTSMLDDLAGELADPEETKAWRLAFFEGVVGWSHALEEAQGNAEAGRYVFDLIRTFYSADSYGEIDGDEMIARVAGVTGILPGRINKVIIEGIYQAAATMNFGPRAQAKEVDDGDGQEA